MTIIGKLTRFELKKTLSGKFFPCVLCVLLAVNVFLLCGFQEWYEWRNSPDNPLRGEGASFWESSKNARITTDYLRKEYAVFGDLSAGELAAFQEAMQGKYGKNVFDDFLLPSDEMLETPGYFGTQTCDMNLIMDYQSLLEANQTCRDTFDSVVRSAKSFGREALADGDNYGIRRNLRIIELYSVERGEITSIVRGWSQFLFDTPTMLLVFLMVLLSSAGSFTGERDRQTWLLLHTAKSGKGKTLTAKYLSGAVLAAGLTILFQLSSLAAVWFQGGLMGAGQPVCALEELRLFPYPITIWQYALLNLACQIFSAVLLSVLLNTVSALCRSSIVSYSVGAVLLGISMIPVYAQPRSEWLSGPLSLSEPLHYFDSYCTADLFGFPVLWVVVLVVLWSIFSAISILLAHKVSHRKGRAI